MRRKFLKTPGFKMISESVPDSIGAQKMIFGTSQRKCVTLAQEILERSDV